MNHAPPSSYRLMEVIAVAQSTLACLRDEDGLIAEDEAEIRAALNGEGVSVDSILTALGRAVLDAQTYAGLISERRMALQARQDRAERRIETIRAALLQAMQAIGLTTFGDPEFSASWRMGKPKVHVTSVDELPEACVRTIREPNKRAIGEMLAEGTEVPGASLSNAAPILVLRSK